MAIATTEDTKKIHSAYRALTGLDIPYTMHCHYAWELWLARGWNEPDLACVIRYIKGRIKNRRREKESLLFRNLILNIENFSEDLAISRAESKNERRETPRQEILRAAGRPEQPKDKVQPVKSILEGKALSDFMFKCKQEAGLI